MYRNSKYIKGTEYATSLRSICEIITKQKCGEADDIELEEEAKIIFNSNSNLKALVFGMKFHKCNTIDIPNINMIVNKFLSQNK